MDTNETVILKKICITHLSHEHLSTNTSADKFKNYLFFINNIFECVEKMEYYFKSTLHKWILL